MLESGAIFDRFTTSSKKFTDKGVGLFLSANTTLRYCISYSTNIKKNKDPKVVNHFREKMINRIRIDIQSYIRELLSEDDEYQTEVDTILMYLKALVNGTYITGYTIKSIFEFPEKLKERHKLISEQNAYFLQSLHEYLYLLTVMLTRIDS